MNLKEKLENERSVALEAAKHREKSDPSRLYYLGIIDGADEIIATDLDIGNIIWNALMPRGEREKISNRYHQGRNYIYNLAKTDLENKNLNQNGGNFHEK